MKHSVALCKMQHFLTRAPRPHPVTSRSPRHPTAAVVRPCPVRVQPRCAFPAVRLVTATAPVRVVKRGTQ